MKTNRRNRIDVGLAFLLTILLGLASRKFPEIFPETFGKYPGDALWAQMVYWLIGMLVPAASIAKVALCALAISYCDEISQLYQADWINQIRSTTLGHLALGSRFSWFDMLAYSVGIVLVSAAEWCVVRARSRR